jgi:dienelactone hydrolase
MVISEIPGITPEVARLARRIADAGFTIDMPNIIGVPNRPKTLLSTAVTATQACINGEFAMWSRNRSSPIIATLRVLAQELHRDAGGRGVVALGMCLTGNFGLALMIEPAMMGAVLSQPSLPAWPSDSARAALGVSNEELRGAKERIQNGARILGLRFTHDRLCRAARFETLRNTFGSAFEGIEIDSAPGNEHKIPSRAHSVLTNDLVDHDGHPTKAALDRVFAFLREQLH